MHRSIIRRLKAPTFQDKRKFRSGLLTNWALLVGATTAFLFLIMGILFAAESRLIIVLLSSTALFAVLGIKVLLNRGHVTLSGMLLSLTIWLSFSFPVFCFDGIRDLAVTGYFLVITLAGMILGKGALLFFSLLVCFTVVAAFYAEKTGIIVTLHASAADSLDLATLLITLAINAILTGVAMHLISQMYQRARENAKAVSETNRKLERALDEIKTLTGLLPICMHCKKVRDGRGYWNQIEAYIEDHSDATFTHSICEACSEKHLKDYGIHED